MTTHSNPGSRRWSRGAQLAVWGCALFLVAALVPGCGLDSPSSPNQPGDLQGNTPNQWSNFQGSIQIVVPTDELPADDSTTLAITAVVSTSSGQPVTNLTPVTFTTNLGSFGADPDVALTQVTVGAFGGRSTAQLHSFQRQYGTATVYASVGNVSARVKLDLEYVEVRGSLSLAFRVQGQDFFNMSGPASAASPFYIGIVGMTLDETGNPLRGAKVNFRIVIDDTTGSGIGPARLDGEPISYTNNDGEGFNQLRVVGAGRVVLEADLQDPVTGDVVATSNQIILRTTEAVFLQLAFDDGNSTFNSGGAGGTKGLIATATDAAGDPVEGVFVRYEIVDDATDSASVAPANAVTAADGRALSAVTVPTGTALDIITVVAKIIDSSGNELATSNTVTYTY